MASAFDVRVRQMMGAQRTSLRSFSGAQQTRLTADWSPFNQSPDQETRYVIGTLRARARQLVRDNSHAAGFVQELANQVIGPDGIMLQAKIKLADGETENRKANSAIEDAWTEWGMPENATADGYESWADFQRTTLKTIATDGEVFIQKLPYFNNSFAYSLRIIDADLVDETLNRYASETENAIRMGIEVDQWNRPVAYHIWTAYFGDLGQKRERKRVLAKEIIHRFVRYRPNQLRGVTWFAPVLLNLHYLDGYEFNELTASRAAAGKMGFIKNMSPEAVAGFQWKEGQEPKTMDVEPGLIQELLPGQEFESFDPTHPSTAFRDFTKTVLRAIARGLGMAYTTLTGDLEAVNYSSIRAGLLSERDQYRTLQKWLAIHIHRPIYREWVQMALATGALRVDGRIAANYYDVSWQARGWKWVDPVNDLTSSALAIALGLDSRSRLAAEQGRDYEEIVDELARELKYADEKQVNVEGEQAKLAKQTIPTQGGQAEQTPDGSEAEDTSAGPSDTSAPGDTSRARGTVRALRLALNQTERIAR